MEYTYIHTYIVNDLKFFHFKKGGNRNLIKSERLCKQVRDHIVWKQVEDTA